MGQGPAGHFAARNDSFEGARETARRVHGLVQLAGHQLGHGVGLVQGGVDRALARDPGYQIDGESDGGGQAN